MERKAYQFKIEKVADDRSFEGFLSVYGNVDSGKDVVLKGAFTKTLAERGPRFPLMDGHWKPIGYFDAKDRDKGLWIKGHFTRNVQLADECYALMKDRVLTGLSIGYEVVKKEAEDGIRYLKELILIEGSVCMWPMNEEAVVSTVKTKADDFPWATKLAEFSAEVKAVLAD